MTENHCTAPFKVLIPCEPFEASIYDMMHDRFRDVRVTGYWVAIRELENPREPLFSEIALASGAKHGVVAYPQWEEVQKDSASPPRGIGHLE
jgi:hypothetical protein